MEKFVEWEDLYSVDNEVLDDHHKTLFRIINDIHNCLEKESDCQDEVLAKVTDDLLDYTDYHFRLEEIVMKEMDYPNIAEHLRQHELFEAKAQSFKEQVITYGTTAASKRILGYLADWLKTHILAVDGDYAAYKKINR